MASLPPTRELQLFSTTLNRTLHFTPVNSHAQLTNHFVHAACLQVLVTELPILQIIPIEANKLKLANTFRSPVYVTQARRSAMGVGLVFEADLSTEEHPSHWVLQGVALVLNTD